MYSFLLKQIVVTYSVQPRADQAYGLASNLRIQAHCVRPLSPVRSASYEEKASRVESKLLIIIVRPACAITERNLYA